MNKKTIYWIIIAFAFFIVGFLMGNIPTELFHSTGSVIPVVLISVPAFIGLYRMYGVWAIATIIGLGIFALTIETIGIHTGFPYSEFQYSSPIGYRLFGTTPWTVAIAWSPLVIGAFLLTHRHFYKWWSQFLVYLALLVSADIVLDPGAVAQGLWWYEDGGFWYGVPYENFLGWLFSGSIAYLILIFFLSKSNAKNTSSIILGCSSYIILITLWSGVNLSYQQYVPTVIGLVLFVVVWGMLHRKPRSL